MGKDPEETGERGNRQRETDDSNDSEDASARPGGREKRAFPIGVGAWYIDDDGASQTLPAVATAVNKVAGSRYTEGEDPCTNSITTCHGRARQFIRYNPIPAFTSLQSDYKT